MSPRIIDSARKHGVSDDVIYYVFSRPVYSVVMRDEPVKIAVFGFDEALRPIELIYVGNDDGEQVIIHAMKATRSFIDWIRNERGESNVHRR